jgi:hypothetical protein
MLLESRFECGLKDGALRSLQDFFNNIDPQRTSKTKRLIRKLDGRPDEPT